MVDGSRFRRRNHIEQMRGRMERIGMMSTVFVMHQRPQGSVEQFRQRSCTLVVYFQTPLPGVPRNLLRAMHVQQDAAAPPPREHPHLQGLLRQGGCRNRCAAVWNGMEMADWGVWINGKTALKCGVHILLDSDEALLLLLQTSLASVFFQLDDQATAELSSSRSKATKTASR